MTAGPGPREAAFAARQRAYFQSADAAKFRWQTRGGLFAEGEHALVAAAAGPGRLLEVGCGEGGNLFHLGPRPGLTVGLDLAAAKIGFAAGAVPWARLACGDVTRLPFKRESFDRVLCRDLLHHLSPGGRMEALREIVRVCRPDGQIVIVEPNGRNPIMRAFGLAVAAERGICSSTPAALGALAEAAGCRAAVHTAQPLPLARVVLHYRLGWPSLGDRPTAARLLAAVERAAGRLVPPSRWAYIVLQRQPAPASAGRSEARREP